MRSKILAVLLTACIAFAVGMVWATPDGEYRATATGGIRLCTAGSSPILVECLADGSATIKLISTSRGNRTWPDDGLGDSGAIFSLRANVPRPFYVSGDQVDSLSIESLDTATEVIVTVTMN